MMLLTHLWQSTLCAAVAALLAIVLRRTHARVRHGIWVVASLKFLVPFALLVPAGQWVAQWTLPAQVASGSVATRWLDRSMSFWSLGVTAGSTGDALPFVVLGVWAIGVAWLIVWRGRRWHEVSRQARGAVRLDEGREVDALRRVMAAGGFASIPLLKGPSMFEPGVLGVMRPKLLWPAGLSDHLTDGELDAILAHELCHVARHDNLGALAQMVVETLFWFYPVVWWVGARLLSERERACDEEVLHMGADRRNYAEAILKVCGFYLRSPLACVAGVGGSKLSERVENIMTRPSASPLTVSGRLLLACAAVLAISAPLAAGVAGAQRAAQASQTSGQDAPQVYRPGKDVTSPKLVHEVKPRYTEEAKAAHIQGMVTMEAVVLESGTVGEVTVTRSLDTEYGLDQEAVKATKQWLFEPGKKDGKAVAVVVEIEMQFTLK